MHLGDAVVGIVFIIVRKGIHAVALIIHKVHLAANEVVIVIHALPGMFIYILVVAGCKGGVVLPKGIYVAMYVVGVVGSLLVLGVVGVEGIGVGNCCHAVAEVFLG